MKVKGVKMFIKCVNMKALSKKITDKKIDVSVEKIDFDNYIIKYDFENEKIRCVKYHNVYCVNNYSFNDMLKGMMKYKQNFKEAIKEKNTPYFDDFEILEDEYIDEGVIN